MMSQAPTSSKRTEMNNDSSASAGRDISGSDMNEEDNSSLSEFCFSCNAAPQLRCPRCLRHFCSFKHAYQHKEPQHCTGVRLLHLYLNAKPSSEEEEEELLDEYDDRDVNFMTNFLSRLRKGENIAERARLKELEKRPSNVSQQMLKFLKNAATARHVNVRGLFDEDEWVTSPPFQRTERKKYTQDAQIHWSIQWSSEDGTVAYSVAREKTTVINAHNTHLETTYKTLASRSPGDDDPDEAFYLVENSDIAKTVLSQFNDEMASIQMPTTAISEKAKPSMSRSDLRHFYLLLGQRSSTSTEVKSVLYLNRKTRIRDALAHQTIYRYPMILVLRVGPRELDPKKYMLVEPYHTEVALPAEPKLTSKPTRGSYTLNYREVKQGQKLYNCLNRWIQRAEASFPEPSDTNVISFRQCSELLAEEASIYSNTLELIKTRHSVRRYYEPVKRLAVHLQNSAGSSKWDSRVAWKCYRSLKDSIKPDLARIVSLGRLIERDSSTAEEETAGTINIPEECKSCIENICNSFYPGLQHGLREHNESESHFNENRKMDKGQAARAQGLREGYDDTEDSPFPEQQLESLGDKGRPSQPGQPALETLETSDIESLVQQELRAQFGSGDRSARKSDVPNENIPRGNAQTVEQFSSVLEKIKSILNEKGNKPITNDQQELIAEHTKELKQLYGSRPDTIGRGNVLYDWVVAQENSVAHPADYGYESFANRPSTLAGNQKRPSPNTDHAHEGPSES